MTDWTPEELRRKCEDGREVGHPTQTWRSVTGERYVTIGHQKDGAASIPGTVDEGCPRETAFDEETAFWTAWNAFSAYSHDRKGKLYWRWPPSLEWSGDKTQCLFYMRCLISDAPEIE